MITQIGMCGKTYVIINFSRRIYTYIAGLYFHERPNHF